MKNVLVLILALAVVTACKKKDNPPYDGPCDQEVVLDEGLYNNGPDDTFFFESVNLSGDCLEVVIQYGGGCGEIELDLIDAEAILESLPVQRNIRVALMDKDSCEALVTETRSFDLTPLQIGNENKILLNLDGWEDQILYEY
jgi:hypothetical protein